MDRWTRKSFDSEREFDDDDDCNTTFGADGMERYNSTNLQDDTLSIFPTTRSLRICYCGQTLHQYPSRYELTGTFEFNVHRCHFF